MSQTNNQKNSAHDEQSVDSLIESSAPSIHRDEENDEKIALSENEIDLILDGSPINLQLSGNDVSILNESNAEEGDESFDSYVELNDSFFEEDSVFDNTDGIVLADISTDTIFTNFQYVNVEYPFKDSLINLSKGQHDLNTFESYENVEKEMDKAEKSKPQKALSSLADDKKGFISIDEEIIDIIEDPEDSYEEQVSRNDAAHQDENELLYHDQDAANEELIEVDSLKPQEQQVSASKVKSTDIPTILIDEESENLNSLKQESQSMQKEVRSESLPSPLPKNGSHESAAEHVLNNEQMTNLLKYLDQLFSYLPEDKIKEFAKSNYYDIYNEVLSNLGI